MSEPRPDEVGDVTPTIEVTVFRHGDLVATELCESEEEAAAVVSTWEEVDGVECEVNDLARARHDETAFEVEPTDDLDAHHRQGEEPAG